MLQILLSQNAYNFHFHFSQEGKLSISTTQSLLNNNKIRDKNTRIKQLHSGFSGQCLFLDINLHSFSCWHTSSSFSHTFVWVDKSMLKFNIFLYILFFEN